MNAKNIGVSGNRMQGMVRMAYTWPIVISVEADDVGVEGESRDGPWMVMTGRRPYRCNVDQLTVFGPESFTDLQFAVSSLVAGDEGGEKVTGTTIFVSRMSVGPKSATDLGEGQCVGWCGLSTVGSSGG
jgi:hypothetical protein